MHTARKQLIHTQRWWDYLFI